MFITDTSGNRSLTATVAFFGFVVVMVKVLLNGASISIAGGASYSFGSIDSLTVAAIMSTILGAYTVRRLGDPAPQSAPAQTVTNGSGSKPNGGAA